MNGNMYSPIMTRRPAGTDYDFPEKEVKKDKKWSFGSIFRRKKKNLSESSSEDENNKMNFLQRRKKKNAARKKQKQIFGKFDHVVMPQNPRGSYNTLNSYQKGEDPSAIFSDPTCDISNRTSIHNLRSDNSLNQYLNYQGSDRSDITVSRNSLGSADSFSKKNRKEMTKARAEARRENLKYESSSDEESQRSGSSAAKFRSDESLSKYSSLGRRSRIARTERYLRRHSKDEEFQNPKLAYKSDLENGRLKMKSPSRSNPTGPQGNQVPFLANYSAFDPSGMLTIPPSHNTSKRNRNFTVTACCFDNGSFDDHLRESASSANPNVRSMSYESHMDQQSPTEIVHGRLPLGIPISQTARTPPLPPPRDPRRIVTIAAYDSSRPNSFCLESGVEAKNGLPRNRSPLILKDKRIRNATDIPGLYFSNNRSTSEDQIPLEPITHSLTVRPASTTPDMNGKSNDKDHGDFSFFLTDSQPRSRKPLSIHSLARNEININNLYNGRSKACETFNFWKQKEDEVHRHKSEPITKILPKSPILSNRIISDENKNDVPQSALLVNAVTKSPVERVRGLTRELSPFRPISPAPKIPLSSLNRSKSVSPGLHVPSESLSEKSSSPNTNNKKPENLEDALNELEEIYNSLRLGDEDLLDRAEKREADICKEVANSLLNSNSRRKRFSSSRSADIREDDLAFRKYSKERSKTIGDPHSVTSSISYLLASPLSGDLLDKPEQTNKNKKEPDVTFDDLLYRSIKQTNNTLKVLDPQPPFGIPLGPISSAPNSDYLHADPEIGRREKVSKKIPDIVKDDLAYRSLRKDSNKEPALPPTSPIGDANNNKTFLIPLHKFNPSESFRKKRAVRSMSANIFNLMQKEQNDRVKNELEIAKSLTEIADAMEQTRMMLKEQDKTITETRKGFASDGEAIMYSPKMDAMKRSRANFLDEMKSFEIPSVPPHLLTNGTKSTNESNENDINSNSSKTLDELLTALAVETRETSDRITNELRMLDEVNILKKSPLSLKKLVTNQPLDQSEAVVDSNMNSSGSLEETTIQSDRDDNVCEIPSVVEEITLPEKQDETPADDFPVELIARTLSNESNDKAEHAKMCEKLMECVVENAEIVSDTVESDHVQHLPSEDTKELDAETSVASVVLTPKEEDALENTPNPIETEIHSEPDYENLKYRSEDEANEDEEPEENTAEDVTIEVDNENKIHQEIFDEHEMDKGVV